MPLLFIGIDPNTGDRQSPTVWVDTDALELVFQGCKAGPDLQARCAETEVPGHAAGIPDTEAVIRIPAHMAPIVREACDAIERAHVR